MPMGFATARALPLEERSSVRPNVRAGNEPSWAEPDVLAVGQFRLQSLPLRETPAPSLPPAAGGVEDRRTL